MNKNKKMLKLLYRSFDDRLQEKEQKKLTQALENSPELQQEKKQIEAQRLAVANTAAQSFKPFFVERMMEQVNALGGKTNGLDLQLFYESLVSVFRRFAVVGAVISVLLFVYNQGIGDILSLEEALTMSDITLRALLTMF
ncbi:MAG: hypothetical protein PVH61_35675 [Candidatus Aminicenantes bacterium]|jgi:hypothetical protein